MRNGRCTTANRQSTLGNLKRWPALALSLSLSLSRLVASSHFHGLALVLGLQIRFSLSPSPPAVVEFCLSRIGVITVYCEEDCGKRWRAYIQIALSCTCTTKRVSRFALPWALSTEPGHWELQVMATYTSAALVVCAFVSCTFTFLTATASLHTLNVRLIDGLQIWREKTKR